MTGPLLPGATRRSFVARVRGWTDDAAGAEQRLKDLDTFTRSLQRRWVLIGGGFAIGLVGWMAGAVRATPGTMVLEAGAAAVTNALVGLVNERGWYRWWLIYVLALLDVAVASLLVVWFGHGGFVAALFLAALPYAFDQGQGVGDFLILATSLAYLVAVWLHNALYEGGAPLDTAVYLETLVFLAVALTLQRIPATLIRRIRHARGVMSDAERGALAVRAPAGAADELGFLERSFNRMLEEIAGTISAVQREADEVAAFAEELAAAAEQLHATSEAVTQTSHEVAGDLATQRGVVEQARTDSAQAAAEAQAQRERAGQMRAESARLAAAADRGRDRATRAGQTLRAIGDDVRATAATVAELAGMSERIGGFAQTIARIARQTHLLALNAAIEAARAGEHGEGFAVVASEVRSLAGEAGRSARDVAELVSELQAGIDAAARAMRAGEAQVRDTGAVAAEADGALRELVTGVREITAAVEATAAVAEAQERRLGGLAGRLERVAAATATAAERADGAARATQGQIAAMTDLTQTSQQLAQLAERLRGSIARFSVLAPSQATAEHPVPPADAAD